MSPQLLLLWLNALSSGSARPSCVMYGMIKFFSYLALAYLNGDEELKAAKI